MEGRKLSRILCATAFGFSAVGSQAHTEPEVRKASVVLDPDLSPACTTAEEGTKRVALLIETLCPFVGRGVTDEQGGRGEDSLCRSAYKLYKMRKAFEKDACRSPRFT